MDDPEPPRRVETVDFAVAPVGGPGRRSRSVAIVAAALVVLGSVVAFGTLGRSDPGGGTAQDAARATGETASAAEPVATGAARAGPSKTANPSRGGLRASGPEALDISVHRTAGGLSVRGTVLQRSVSSLEVRVVDADGADIAARSLSLEYPDAGAIRPGIDPAFEVLIGLSEGALRQAQFLEVDAYDSLGSTIGSALHWLGPLPAPCAQGRDCSSS